MILRRSRRCFFLVVLVAVLAASGLVPAGARAQAPDSARTRLVQILAADSLSGGVVDGERVQRLIGGVRLRQDSTLVFARRATEYGARQEYVFEGDVLIVDAGDTLRADRVRYAARTKIGRAEGDVRLADGEVEVFAPSGQYFVDEKRSVFEEGVRLVDSTTTLTSRGGVYFSDDERAEFAGEVRLTEPRTRLAADSVTYYRADDVAEARGDVRIVRLGDDEDAPPPDSTAAAPADTLSRTYLFGAYAYNDERSGTSRVEGDSLGGAPLLVRVRVDSAGAADTLVVRARRLATVREDSLQRLTAVGAVRVWQRDLAAVADSAVFDRIDGEPVLDDVRLFRSPVAWFETSQVTGDTLLVVGRGGEVERLVVPSDAFVAQEDTVLGRVHQLRGERIVGYFEADTLRRVDVGPAAEVIRFRRTDGAPDGAIQATAARLVVRFDGGALRRVSGYDGIEGTVYAESILPPDLALPGFRWMPERRPTKAALLPPDLLPLAPPEGPLPTDPPAPLVVDDAEG